MKSQAQLTSTQLTANREAIHNFIYQVTKKTVKGSVIILPEFEEQSDGSWAPTSHVGARLTKTNSVFVRFGKQVFDNGRFKYLFTNFFSDAGEQEMMNILEYIDPNATIGSAIKGVKLVTHESVFPFSKSNPERDIKWANKEDGIKCMKYIIDPVSGELIAKLPIYRRVVVFFANEEGVYTVPVVPQDATPELLDRLMKKTPLDNLIYHDNVDEISDNAIGRFTAQSEQLKKDALIRETKEARLAELEGKETPSKAEQREIDTLIAELGN